MLFKALIKLEVNYHENLKKELCFYLVEFNRFSKILLTNMEGNETCQTEK
jgi:hypothetical protein